MNLYHCHSLVQGGLAVCLETDQSVWYVMGRGQWGDISFCWGNSWKPLSTNTPHSWGSKFYSVEGGIQEAHHSLHYIFFSSFTFFNRHTQIKHYLSTTLLSIEDITVNKADKNPWLGGVYSLLNKRKHYTAFTICQA